MQLRAVLPAAPIMHGTEGRGAYHILDRAGGKADDASGTHQSKIRWQPYWSGFVKTLVHLVHNELIRER